MKCKGWAVRIARVRKTERTTWEYAMYSTKFCIQNNVRATAGYKHVYIYIHTQTYRHFIFVGVDVFMPKFIDMNIYVVTGCLYIRGAMFCDGFTLVPIKRHEQHQTINIESHANTVFLLRRKSNDASADAVIEFLFFHAGCSRRTLRFGCNNRKAFLLAQKPNEKLLFQSNCTCIPIRLRDDVSIGIINLDKKPINHFTNEYPVDQRLSEVEFVLEGSNDQNHLISPCPSTYDVTCLCAINDVYMYVTENARKIFSHSRKWDARMHFVRVCSKVCFHHVIATCGKCKNWVGETHIYTLYMSSIVAGAGCCHMYVW